MCTSGERTLKINVTNLNHCIYLQMKAGAVCMSKDIFIFRYRSVNSIGKIKKLDIKYI